MDKMALFILVLGIFLPHFKCVESDDTLSVWSLYDLDSSSQCNDTAQFAYNIVMFSINDKLQCITKCEMNDACSVVLMNINAPGEQNCILANNLSGCPDEGYTVMRKRESNTCSNGGQLFEGECRCPNYTSGLFCEIVLDSCLSEPCYNFGECVLTSDYTFICQCRDGYDTGEFCETVLAEDECYVSPGVTPCGDNGSCQDYTGYYTCSCDDGNSGTNCEINHCLAVACENGGILTPGIESCGCACQQGFTGERCETDIDECQADPCSVESTCLDNINGFSCLCDNGFAGNLCETDLCENVACTDNGDITRGSNSCECICHDGFTGETCETDIDDCQANPCSVEGTCVDEINGFTCQCNDGYGGSLCDIDHCLEWECAYGSNQRFAGGCNCACINGFDGSLCTDAVPEYVPSYDERLTVDNGFYTGEWGAVDSCLGGSFVTGVTLTICDSVHDDWGVDTIELTCSDMTTLQATSSLTSVDLNWGDRQPGVFCPESYFVVGFRLYNEPSQGGGDDSTTNNIELKCRGPGIEGNTIDVIQGNGDSQSGSEWGSWSDSCTDGMAVLAFQVKYEDNQGLTGDDTAIGDVTMFCG